jgi:hypothetical protein
MDSNEQAIKVLRLARESINECIELLTVKRPREYERTLMLDPGAGLYVEYGVDIVVPGTAFPGLPETSQTLFGLEHKFELRHLIVDDECASAFDITQVFLGQKSSWRFGVSVPASKFAASVKEKLVFGTVCAEGLTINVQVQNKTDKPQRFRAKLVGTDHIAAEDVK